MISPARSQKSEDRSQNMKYVRSFLQIVIAILREIFDENAYQRFLARTGRESSTETYAAFMREREAGMATRPKCC